MANTDAYHFAVYEPFGARIDLYPEVSDCSMAFPYASLGDGVLNLTMNIRAHAAQLLEKPHEIALEVNGVEVDDGRFLALSRSVDEAEGDVRNINLTCPNYSFLLQKAKVIRASTAEKRTFLNKSPGNIMRTLVGEAKSRGWGEGVYVDFNPEGTANATGTDSAGKTWPTLIEEISYEYGLDILSVARNMVDQGLCDIKWSGRKLQMFAPGSINYDKKNVNLIVGQHLDSAPTNYSWVDYASAVWVYGKEVAGNNGPDQHQRTRTVGADGVLPPWGRWETTVSQESITGTSTLNRLGDWQLDQDMRQKAEHTVGLKFTEDSPMPFAAYGPGNWLYITKLNQANYWRCRQITLTVDVDGGWGGNLVMNDRFLENELKVARRVRGITGGSDIIGGI